jgi:ribosomal-protein-serine acetyltransferase
VAVGNVRSAAIPRRLGFTEEGVLRQAERHRDGYKDNTVFSILADEWRTGPLDD